jgi:hypothetical protein
MVGRIRYKDWPERDMGRRLQAFTCDTSTILRWTRTMSAPSATMVQRLRTRTCNAPTMIRRSPSKPQRPPCAMVCLVRTILRRSRTGRHHARTRGRRICTFEGAFRSSERQEFLREHRPRTDDVGPRPRDAQPMAQNRRGWTRPSQSIANERQEMTCGRRRISSMRQQIGRDRQDLGRTRQSITRVHPDFRRATKFKSNAQEDKAKAEFLPAPSCTHHAARR